MGDVESMNGSLGGEGGLEEQADVGAVVCSAPMVRPSDVRELLMDAQEKRAVSFRGSRRRRSADTLMEPARVVAVELTRLERMVEIPSSCSRVIATQSTQLGRLMVNTCSSVVRLAKNLTMPLWTLKS